MLIQVSLKPFSILSSREKTNIKAVQFNEEAVEASLGRLNTFDVLASVFGCIYLLGERKLCP